MLIGSYPGSLNEKRRVAIPKKLIEELGQKLIIAKWYENCLVIVNLEFWDRLLGRLVGPERVAGIGVRGIERFILGSAFELEPDDQGRIVIPEILSNYAGLEKEIVFIGLTNRIEVWPKKIWDEISDKLSAETKDYIEKLAND